MSWDAGQGGYYWPLMPSGYEAYREQPASAVPVTAPQVFLELRKEVSLRVNGLVSVLGTSING